MTAPEFYVIEQWPSPPQDGVLSWLTTPTGNLRCAHWTGSFAGSSRGTIVLAHGLSEHIEKYYHVVAKLLERGFSVAMMDARGHGMSAKFNNEEDYYQQLKRDLAQFMQDKVLDILPAPYLGVAHSMSSCLLCCATHDHPEWFKGVVLSSPLLGIKAARHIPLFAHITAAMKFMPIGIRQLFTATKPSCFTNDQKRFSSYCKLRNAYPALTATRDTVLFADSVLNLFAVMRTAGWYQKIKTPVLMFTAEQEDLVDNKATEEAATQIPNAQLNQIASARHEIFMELDMVQEHLWAKVDQFLQEHAPHVVSTPAAPEPPPRDSIQLKI